MQVPGPVAEPIEEVAASGVGQPDERGYFEMEPGTVPAAEPTHSTRRPINRAARDPILESRPHAPYEEVQRRKRNILILGIVLITVFFLPTCQANYRGGGMKLTFMNIEALFTSRVDAMTKFMMLYPLLAGIAVAVVAFKMTPPWRGIVLMLLGLAPVVVSLLDPATLNVFRSAGPDLGSIGITMFLFFLGGAGVFIGSRARWYRPQLTTAFIIGAIGGVMLIISFFVPTKGEMMIQAPFEMMDKSVMGGLGILIAFCLFIGAGVFCLINVPGRALSQASRLSGIAFRALVGATVIFPTTGMLAGMIAAMQRGGDITVGLAIIWMMLKIIAWFVGIFLLLPIGITDAMVDVPVTDPDGCSSCGYDLRGNSGGGVCPECGHVNW